MKYIVRTMYFIIKRPITRVAYYRRLIETLSEEQCSIPRARTGPRTSQALERLQPVRYFMKKGRSIVIVLYAVTDKVA